MYANWPKPNEKQRLQWDIELKQRRIDNLIQQNKLNHAHYHQFKLMHMQRQLENMK